ncbi:M24 family metallopeptidase [Candidatus Uhrbacteria bacterium]|nr:M24 family metallopeptidase [Candidatus Uhrbacteria bacterium]
MQHGITIKTEQELKLIKEGGKKLARILDKLCKMVKPGVMTSELDVAAERMIRECGGEPAFKGYQPRPDIRPFSTTICACLNNEVVHAPAVPSRMIKAGDLIKIDIGMRWPAKGANYESNTNSRISNSQIRKFEPHSQLAPGGLYTDHARTVMVGKVDKKVRELVGVTEKALKIGIKQVRAGHRVSHISRAIEKFVEKFGFGIVRDLVGHGVGYKVHEPPEIPNFWMEGFPDPVLQEGMVIAIEPMINLGTWRVKVLEDGWTIVSADGSPSAHFEHTVIVRKRGAEIVTK